jgi:hypothetical protein
VGEALFFRRLVLFVFFSLEESFLNKKGRWSKMGVCAKPEKSLKRTLPGPSVFQIPALPMWKTDLEKILIVRKKQDPGNDEGK